MPAIATENNLSTGACGQTPTLPIGPFTSTVTFAGRKVQWRGVTVYNDHPDRVTHHGSRTVKTAQSTASTFFFENHPVAFEGDLIDDNDAIAPLAGNTSFG